MPSLIGNSTWFNYIGQFEPTADALIFHGHELEVPVQTSTTEASDPPTAASSTDRSQAQPPERQVSFGFAVTNHRFREGRIDLIIEFEEVDERTYAEVVIQVDANKRPEFGFGIGSERNTFFALRQWLGDVTPTQKPDEKRGWFYLVNGGDRKQLQAGVQYKVSLSVAGSSAVISVNDIEVGNATIPASYTGSQIGVLCASHSRVYYRELQIHEVKPTAFVVMQFDHTEYDSLYKDVICVVCEEAGFRAYRADETFEPGLVVADIQRRIIESTVVIAEITPINGNVYYEVGYADALKKPIILLADKASLTKIPFDVQPYRRILYDNTIGGKNKVHESLKKYLEDFLSSKRF